MDINKLLENYGIYLLIIIYIIINIAYKKIINIVIFLMSLLATINLVDKKLNAVLIAYVLSICYGIIVNFHLIENFKGVISKFTNYNYKETKKPIISNSQETSNENTQPKKSNSLDNELASQRVDVQAQINNDNILEFISDDLIKKFLEMMNLYDNNLVIYKKVSINNMNPLLSDLDSNKVKKFLNNYNEGKFNIGKSSIILSQENNIIDGHHRWYAYKLYCENNNSADQTLDVILIDLPLKKIIKRLKEYRIEYNREVYKTFQLDNKSMVEAGKCIKNIQKDINTLSKNYNNLQKITLL